MTPPRGKRGPAPKLTRLQQIELWAWYCAKRELGTYKALARRMGVSVDVLMHACERMRRRERAQANRIGAQHEVRA